MERHKFQGESRSINGFVAMRCAYRANDTINSVCLKLEIYEWHIPWEECLICDGFGLITVQVLDMDPGYGPVWENEAHPCLVCPKGLEWKELLND